MPVERGRYNEVTGCLYVCCVVACTCVLQPPPHAGIEDGNPKYQIVNAATGRCLTVAAPLAGSNETNRTVLLPCLTVEGRTNLASLWEFDRGVTTVTSVSSAVTGQALAVSNATLYATLHAQDAFAVSDLAYGNDCAFCSLARVVWS